MKAKFEVVSVHMPTALKRRAATMARAQGHKLSQYIRWSVACQIGRDRLLSPRSAPVAAGRAEGGVNARRERKAAEGE